MQNVIDQTPKDILIVQGVWNAKFARMLMKTGMAFADPSAIMKGMRGLRLLEFATFNDFVFANTFGHHKAIQRLGKTITRLITF